MKNSLLLTLLMFCSVSTFAQQDAGWQWRNPAHSQFAVIEGQAWPVTDTYDRLPAKAEKTVPPKVWNLSGDAAGLSVRFRTSAPDIVVRYVVSGKLDMPHMPATGASGVDLYSLDPNGAWKWSAGRYNFGDTITYRFSNMSKEVGEYRLYLPPYNVVKWLEIGIQGPDSVLFLPARTEKPIVIYGTSIVQGACASRPGHAWTSILDRMMDRPVINLGFAGNGKLDTAVTALLTDIDAKVYVLDCLPNLSSDITQKVLTAVRQIRKVRPHTPILLAEHAKMNGNADLEAAYEQLLVSGVKELYLLSATDLGLGMESTVDGTHPNDIGMQLYADAYAKSLRQIFHEPVGNINTTIPCRQYRELVRYDWDARHHDILAANKKQAPKVICLGNSITHFWELRYAESWKKWMAPLGARNMGYGWDRVENVLWRVYHDELDGYAAKKVLIMIGTNNLQMNTDEEIVAGLRQLVLAIRDRQPQATILLSGILPRVDKAERVIQINQLILQMAGEVQVQFVNPGTTLLKADMTPDSSLFTDGLHPNDAGYSKIGTYLQSYLQ